MDEEEEKKKFETEENDGKGKKKRLNIEALCERLKRGKSPFTDGKKNSRPGDGRTRDVGTFAKKAACVCP